MQSKCGTILNKGSFTQSVTQKKRHGAAGGIVASKAFPSITVQMSDRSASFFNKVSPQKDEMMVKQPECVFRRPIVRRLCVDESMANKHLLDFSSFILLA